MPQQASQKCGNAMAYNALWTSDAQHDLDVAVSYLTEGVGMPTAASKLLNDIESQIDTPRTFPKAHERVRDGLLATRGYRKAMADPYLVLYLVDTEHSEVVITNIVHGSRGYAHLV